MPPALILLGYFCSLLLDDPGRKYFLFRFFKKSLDKRKKRVYNIIVIWVWRRLVARYLGVVEAAGSNPVTQTINHKSPVSCFVERICRAFYFCFLIAGSLRRVYIISVRSK